MLKHTDAGIIEVRVYANGPDVPELEVGACNVGDML